MPQNLFLVLVEVKRICHEDAIQRRQGKCARKIGAYRVDILRGPEKRTVRLLQFAKPGTILINRVDFGFQSDQFAQGKRECATSRAEVRPYAALRYIRRAQKLYMIPVVHGGMVS